MCQALVFDGEHWKAKELISYKLNENAEIAEQPLLERERIINLNLNPKELLFKKNLPGREVFIAYFLYSLFFIS